MSGGAYGPIDTVKTMKIALKHIFLLYKNVHFVHICHQMLWLCLGDE